MSGTAEHDPTPAVQGDAARYAQEAGRLLQALRRDSSRVGAYALGDLGDARANALLLQRIRADHPHDAILSEESADVGDRGSARRVWIIDPLDGTREFREGRDDWAVHVAVWERGLGLVESAVALPDHDLVLPAGARGASRSGRIVSSRTRTPMAAALAADALGLDVLPMGSAGAKAAAVARGIADAYVHAGGLNEWDAAAPVGMALASGLHASHLDGSEIVFNARDPWIHDLLICVPELAEPIIAVLRDQWW